MALRPSEFALPALSSPISSSFISPSSFFFFNNLSVNILSDLVELKLCSKDLVFLLLQGTFCFFQSCLEFLLFLFRAAPLLVKIMDRSTTISQLIKKISNLISQIFIFPLDYIQCFHCFIMTCSKSKKL